MNYLFKKIFILEGNIGAGKSTLLSIIKKHNKNIAILQEPVKEWKNVGGEDLLSAFYDNPKRWCFCFEIYSMYTLFKNLMEALKLNTGIIIMERSLFSNRAFQIISSNYGNLDNKEKAVLTELYNYFKNLFPNPNGVIYINTDPKICLKRIKIRGRPEEDNIDFEYLKKLENEFFKIKYNCPIIYVNGEYDIKKPQKLVDNIIKFISEN